MAVCIEYFLPIAGTLLFDEKIRQSAALFWHIPGKERAESHPAVNITG
jgi:hypothetical protein